MPLRFGLVGTGHWASEVHAPALADRTEGPLVGVWGRNPDKARRLADPHGAQVFERPGDLFAAVDVVSFAVPPDVQARLAIDAARAGCHLLLEKPTALNPGMADDLAAATRDHVASVVFFTSRFAPAISDWIARLQRMGPWQGGRATWLGSIFEPGNPFGESPWRRREGALWDVGPHALSVLLPVLGPVTDVCARPGGGDTTHLVLQHGAASATVTVSLTVPPEAALTEAAFYGDSGWEVMPASPTPVADCLARALDELVGSVRVGKSHPCDAAFGAEVVRALARAAGSRDSGWSDGDARSV